jgi:hypothetical protein
VKDGVTKIITTNNIAALAARTEATGQIGLKTANYADVFAVTAGIGVDHLKNLAAPNLSFTCRYTLDTLLCSIWFTFGAVRLLLTPVNP